MRFIDFSRICERLEGQSGRLEMIETVSQQLPSLTETELPLFVRFVMGKIFPDWSPQKIGIGPSLLYESVAYVAGKNKSAVIDLINRTGDAGRAVEELLANKEQKSFFIEPLDLEEVNEDFTTLASIEGMRSQREKVKILRRLFANAQPLEGRYLTRLILGELRIGIGEGNVRDAVARAFDIPPELVEHAHQATNDLGQVALLARQGEKALKEVQIRPFRPVKMMLAQQGTIAEMITEHGDVIAEYKYDGSRIQFHRVGDECHIYSRKLEEVTGAIPDIVELLMDATSHDVILDGEVMAVKGDRPLPFQYVLRRFRRKHDVSLHVEEIRLVPRVFDILYFNGTTLIDRSLTERRSYLERALSDHLAPQVVSRDPAVLDTFYQSALSEGHEGIMLKAPGSPYTPGVRGKLWVKIKPEVDTVDLAVIGAEWGEGKRAHIFGSFLLACQDQGELIPVSRVATGFSDENLQEIFDLVKDSVISRSGKSVRFEPELVFEVGYAEIQKSPNYEGGYALRFPRFIRIRDDKSVDQVETLDQIRDRYGSRF